MPAPHRTVADAAEDLRHVSALLERAQRLAEEDARGLGALRLALADAVGAARLAVDPVPRVPPPGLPRDAAPAPLGATRLEEILVLAWMALLAAGGDSPLEALVRHRTRTAAGHALSLLGPERSARLLCSIDGAA